MEKVSKFICKYKVTILIIAILLIIPSIIGINATRVNYDILSYLPDGIETIEGEKILSDDFNMGAFSVVLVKDMPQKDIIKLEDKIKEIDSVGKVVSIADITRNTNSCRNATR